ncbi:MAG: iron ABC transporter permease [Bacteroidetes bacterium HGW-Bacteroidetes-10]|nr:MAG: iron ABC transporter permease [Bacteroidetes bacterium HGW-Bacteroidetes-10]
MIMNKNRLYFLIPLLIIILSGAVLLSLGVGEMHLSIEMLPGIFANKDSMEYGVLSQIRIPRTLLAISIGGSLSLAGVILQGIYHNPLVEPYTLGISGGASLGVTLVIVTGINSLGMITLPVSGFAGALVTIFLVYFLGFRRGSVSIGRMLLTGVMISFISSSLILFLMSVTEVENIHGIVFWTMGSLNESNSYMVNGMVAVSIISLAISYMFTTPLNALRLGNNMARHLGINSQQVITFLFILTSLLTGTCIAVAGVIGFVGLIIPHISRIIAGTDYRYLLIVSFLCGSIFLLLCDILARTIIFPNELPIGVITGITGGITFLIIVSQPKLKIKIN